MNPQRLTDLKWICLKEGYPEIRNIIGLHGNAVEIRKWALPNVMNAVGARIFPKSNFPKHTFINARGHQGEVYHLFNGVMFGPGNWVTTMESLLPRLWQFNRPSFNLRCLKALASDNCKAIIAISHRAVHLQSEQLDKWQEEGLINDELKLNIKSKILLLPPPQPILHAPSNRTANDPLKLIFVGNLFFLKGGREAFLACKQIVELEKIALRLIVISSLESDDWFSKTSEKDSEEWKKILSEHKWVEPYKNLPNAEVLKHIQRCHVGIFPTKRDSYGYFTLEAQASGVPVITSDYWVQSEINSNNTGWVVASSKMNDEIDIRLVNDLKECITNAFNEEQRIEKAMSSIDRIEKHHCPDGLKAKLMQWLEIYDATF
jgi:glycosyltransferase involved in cell wall biosynthesis